MANQLILLLENYGATTFNILAFLTIIYFANVIRKLLLKICTNHLKHIQDSILVISSKMDNLEKEFINIDKRVAILESKEDN